jgi:hypothetical protein
MKSFAIMNDGSGVPARSSGDPGKTGIFPSVALPGPGMPVTRGLAGAGAAAGPGPPAKINSR